MKSADILIQISPRWFFKMGASTPRLNFCGAPSMAAPLRGSLSIAFNALSSTDHRRSLNAIDGRERIPQRFAIDWVQRGPDGRLFHGDKKSNADYYDYGAEVLAVADGRVKEVR